MTTLLARNLRLKDWTIAIMAMLVAATTTSMFAQEQSESEKPAAQATASEPDEKAPQAAEKDPFAVPEEADAKQLFEFIDSVKLLRARTLSSHMKVHKAVVEAAEVLRNLDELRDEDDVKAIKAQIASLSFMVRYDRNSRTQMKDFIEELKDHQNPEIARIVAVEEFKTLISSARSATAEEQHTMVATLRELVGEKIDRDGYGLANSLAKTIGYSDNKEIAANLYEELATWMDQSDDKTLNERASRMVGSARRLRLPGKFMELMGRTADGGQFDWNSYRGKVVLVDFWASWCGPCRGEVPNMKRNLAAYSDRGFAIVGINMDNTTKAYEKYVSEEQLSWQNLMSDQEDERGWDHPLAVHYGVTGIPTAILVNEKGYVVSMRARGKELDKLLLDLLGEPKEVELTEEPVAKETANDDSDF